MMEDEEQNRICARIAKDMENGTGYWALD